jgi:hypothetical protein
MYFFLCGVWIISIITFYDYPLIFGDKLLLVCFTIFVSSFAVSGQKFVDLIVQRFPMGKDSRILTSKIPPSQRMDLLRGDVLIVAVSLLPFIAKIIH